MTDRVAGFICKHILKHHSGSVTGLAVVETSSLKHNSSSSSRLFSLADAKTYLVRFSGSAVCGGILTYCL